MVVAQAQLSSRSHSPRTLVIIPLCLLLDGPRAAALRHFYFAGGTRFVKRHPINNVHMDSAPLLSPWLFLHASRRADMYVPFAVGWCSRTIACDFSSVPLRFSLCVRHRIAVALAQHWHGAGRTHALGYAMYYRWTFFTVGATIGLVAGTYAAQNYEVRAPGS